MIPFSFFLIVPGAELLLPFWLSIFPNSLPSQFLSDEDIQKKFTKRKEKQEVAAEKLIRLYPVYFNKLLKEPELDDEDRPALKELSELIRSRSALPTDLLQYRFLFKKYGSFRRFNAKQLVSISHFMSHEPVTGLKTINNILRLPLTLVNKLTKKQIKFELKYDSNWLLSAYAKVFIQRDLELFFTRLREADQLISYELEQLEKFAPEDIKKICFERGINIEQTLAEQIEDLKLWLSISNLRNVPHSLLLVSRINDFQAEQFHVDSNETQDEILRRVSSLEPNDNPLYLYSLKQICSTLSL